MLNDQTLIVIGWLALAVLGLMGLALLAGLAGFALFLVVENAERQVTRLQNLMRLRDALHAWREAGRPVWDWDAEQKRFVMRPYVDADRSEP